MAESTAMNDETKSIYEELKLDNVRRLWLEGVNPNTVYPQECFYRAFLYATDPARYLEEGIWLVHGECALVLGPHAWVELPDGLIFDAVLQQFFRAEDWVEKLMGQAWYRFTPRAAVVIAANMPKTDDNQCSYRWDFKLNLPRFRGVPLEIDFDKAKELIFSTKANKNG